MLDSASGSLKASTIAMTAQTLPKLAACKQSAERFLLRPDTYFKAVVRLQARTSHFLAFPFFAEALCFLCFFAAFLAGFDFARAGGHPVTFTGVT
jgi:hypothetical protein